jgi:hypothetical protein
MKVIYKSDYEQFPGGQIKPRERLEVETTVEEAADLGDNWIKLLKIVQDIRDKGRRE